MPLKTFDQAARRQGTGSIKWDRYAAAPDVLPMWIADMDFLSPPAVTAAVAAFSSQGCFGYAIPTPEQTRSVLRQLARHGLHAQEEHIIFLPGLVPALNNACRAYCGPDDGVLVCTPVYPPFLSAPANQSRRLVRVPLACELDASRPHYSFDIKALEAGAAQSRLALLCHPHNPVGRAWNESELLAFAEVCQRHDLIIISDEIHCDLILDEDSPHIPLAALSPDIASRTVTLMAPSKTYNTAGLCCAFAYISDDTLRQRFRKAMRGFITEVNALGYVALQAAYDHGEPWRQELLQILRRNHRLLQDFIALRLSALRPPEVQATYLAWLDFSAYQCPAGSSFYQHFIDHGLALSDGADFGAPQHLRLNFACPLPQLEEALRRLEAGCHALQLKP